MYRLYKDSELLEEQEALVWVKHEPKTNIPIRCSEEEGEAILGGAYVDDPEDPGDQVWQFYTAEIYRVEGKTAPSFFDSKEEVEVEFVEE